jgi:hypothetical protein
MHSALARPLSAPLLRHILGGGAYVVQAVWVLINVCLCEAQLAAFAWRLSSLIHSLRMGRYIATC